MVNNMKHLCLRSLTEQNILVKEAREKMRVGLIEKGKITSQNNYCSHSQFKFNDINFKVNRENNELNNLMRAINSKSYVDDIFN